MSLNILPFLLNYCFKSLKCLSTLPFVDCLYDLLVIIWIQRIAVFLNILKKSLRPERRYRLKAPRTCVKRDRLKPLGHLLSVRFWCPLSLGKFSDRVEAVFMWRLPFPLHMLIILAGKNWWRFSSESTQDCGLVALMLLAT